MKKEKLISISINNAKYFYKASWLATQSEADGHAKTKGKVPNGKITDYRAIEETTLLYKNGKPAARKQPKDTQTPAEANAAARVKTGKTFTTMFSERIFYTDGRETARQTLDFDGNITESSGEPFTGDAKDFYKDGTLKQEAYFDNGKMEGMVKTYDESGRLISTENYKNGLKEGKAVVHNFMRGLVSEQCLDYRKGKLEGARNAYNAAGTLIGVEHFKNGKLNGVREVFYSTGKIFSRTNYENDLMQGPSITYYETGDIIYEENFEHGKLQGARKGFYPGGKIYLEENYQNNLLDGQRTLYGENGEIKLKQFYKNGALQGNT